jgi:DNA-directed RNA polymerase subunit beta'
MRNFDIDQQFEAIKKAATEAVHSIFPIEGKLRSMRLDSVTVEDKLDQTDYTDQAKTKAKNGTWGVPVYASLSLFDKKTGTVIDKAEKVRLFMLPKITPRYSYIVGGNEYQVTNQLRLKSGVYTLRKQNGDLKTTVNLIAGKNFDLMFNGATGIFTITKIAGGQANIPIYPILTNLGVSAGDIERTWGGEISAANRGADQRVMARAMTAFGIKSGDLKSYFDKTKLNPETTKMTLGQSFSKVDGQMILAASKKLLETHLGKKQPEDLNSLEFKELHSLEDFIKERLEKNKDSLAFKIKRSVDAPTRTKISQIVNPGSFNSVVESFFTQDDKSATPEQTNPLEMISGQFKATIMGEGGIKSQHAITDDVRNIHPTHYGFIDTVHTPESDRIGANLHIPIGATKDGLEIKMKVKDAKGNIVYLKPTEVYNSIIAFPGQTGKELQAMSRGVMVKVPVSQVNYFTLAPQGLFSVSTNLIPYLPANQGNRSMMAAKMLEQAISLKHREAPLVQVRTPDGNVMEKIVGSGFSVTAPVSGKVTKITGDALYIGDKKVNLYDHYSLNRKSYINHEPLVKVGDTVKEGQLIADSNYTKNGTLALGTNMKVAYLPYQGYNFEDGIVITDSAADKLTSVHIHKKSIDLDDNTFTGLAKYSAQYPNTMRPESFKKLDESGVIKKGQVVHFGDTIIAALQKRQVSQDIGVIQRALADRPKDVSVIWTMEDAGTVIDVQKTGKNIIVQIKTEERAKIGDKLSGRMGNKGIITKIIPDHEAPKDKKGSPVEILLNPHGVISRINIGQIYESAAGKVAKKTGKTHLVQNFTGEDYLETTKGLLDKHGVEDKEELFDQNGKSLGKVHVGNPYILKLFKQSTGNFSVRQGGPGHPYDIHQQPLKAGGEESSKSMDLLTMYSLLSHGARANLREMTSLKANQNDEFWKALKSGQSLPAPQAPFVYDKFISYLKGAGIDVKKDGSKLTLAPLTDEAVKKMSSGEVKKVAFYRAKDMEPIKDGFFDPVKFGGFRGKKWGHIELKEPIVNPVFETAVRKITDLGGKYDELMAGTLHYKDGLFNREGKGVTSGAAIEKILDKINVKEQIAELSKKANKASGNVLDDLNKKLRYLKALETHELKPSEAYIRKSVPVVPPIYRPIYPLPDGNITNSDVNFLYQNLGILNTMHDSPVMALLPEHEKADLRKEIYNHVSGISGLTDVAVKGRPREGFISAIKGGIGGQPKEGFFLSKVISKQQDYVGRGTIIPEPSLGVDEVAIPEQMAWKLFEPFIIREIGRSGKSPNDAIEDIKNKTPVAKAALQAVLKQRHIMLNRAPSLHKFSIMAFKPTITTGTAIKIPPLIVKGFNADFDGDTMTVHVPITDEANKEAEKMLPSRNLYQPGTGKLMIAPSQEAQIGMYYLSKTDAGRKRLNAIVGSKFKIEDILNKGKTNTLLTRLSKELTSNEFARVLQELKSEGEKHAFERGFSIGMDDLQVFRKERNKIVDIAEAMVNKSKTQADLSKVSGIINESMDKLLDSKLRGKNNALFDMVDSGARGEGSQLRQILMSPTLVNDAKGNIVPKVMKKSYAEGLDISDYWTSMYGARRGMMDRAVQTSLPGSFSKDIMASTVDNVISAIDCGTKKGIVMDINDSHIADRFLAGNQGSFSHNSLIDTVTISKLKKEGLKTITVRSPLTCKQAKGTCAKCYGLDEHGHTPEIGENIGAKAGQTIAEPLVQLVMNTFHTGGAAGTGASVGGYKRIDQLLRMPKFVAGAATLSPTNGRVTSIDKGIAGGYVVQVGDKKANVSQGLELKVKVGDMVDAGDAISDGVVKPQDLVAHKGMQKAQEYVVSELYKAYKGQKQDIQKKVFETVVRSLSNTTQILSPSKELGFVKGDIAPYTLIAAHNENLEQLVSLEEAMGYHLAQDYGIVKAGTEVTDKEIKILKMSGVKEVKIKKEAIKHAPLLKSVNALPLMKRDWMSALGYRNLAKALVEGAGQSWSTDLEGHHPIPAFAHGATFGKGKDGKY